MRCNAFRVISDIFFGTNVITPHPACQNASQCGKSRTPALPVTVLEIIKGGTKGRFQRRRSLAFSGSVVHAEHEYKRGTTQQAEFAFMLR